MRSEISLHFLFAANCLHFDSADDFQNKREILERLSRKLVKFKLVQYIVWTMLTIVEHVMAMLHFSDRSGRKSNHSGLP